MPQHPKHGQAFRGKKTRLYKVWERMKQRCLNINCPRYKDWGGRGITICDRWKDSFQNFYDDMGDCPPRMSIERIDNDGNYEPSNCRWATYHDQYRNRSTNVFVEWEGQKYIATDLANLVGVPRNRLTDLIRDGIPIKEAVKICQLKQAKYFKRLEHLSYMLCLYCNIFKIKLYGNGELNVT